MATFWTGAGRLASRRDGMALPAVIMVLIVLTIVGFGYLALGFHEVLMTQKQENSRQTFFLAEAGRNRTLYTLSITADWTTLSTELYTDESLGNGLYSVTLEEKTADSCRVESTGEVNGLSRSVTAEVQK